MKNLTFPVMLFDWTTSPCVITILNLGKLQTQQDSNKLKIGVQAASFITPISY